MPTFTQLHYHLVFSTKGRRALIDPSWEDDLYGYIGGIIRQQRGVLLAAGGMPDHVHLLVASRPDIALSDLLRDIKSLSSGWVHNEKGLLDFAWQEGYRAFTVSHSALEDVRHYVRTQKVLCALSDFSILDLRSMPKAPPIPKLIAYLSSV